MPAAPSNGASITTCTAVRVKKFDVARYRHEDVLLGVNQIDDLEIALRKISNARVLSRVQFNSLYVFNHARRILSVTNTAAASSFEESKEDPSATPRIFGKTASVALLDGKHHLQAMRDLHEAEDVA